MWWGKNSNQQEMQQPINKYRVSDLLGCTLYSIGSLGSWQPIINSTYIEKPCQRRCLAKTVHSHLKLSAAPTRKPNLPDKPKLNTHKQTEKPKARSVATQRSPVYKSTSAQRKFYRIERKLEVNTNQSTSFKHPHLIQDRKEETWNLVEICF